MDVFTTEKIDYNAPFAQIVSFPEQDIITISGDAILPMDEWDL